MICQERKTVRTREIGSDRKIFSIASPCRCVGGRALDIKLVNIGFGNIVSANRIVAIISPDSAPIKRIITEARDRGMLIDATYGRRTRAVIVTDSDHVILSAVQPETVANRLASREAAASSEEDEEESQ